MKNYINTAHKKSQDEEVEDLQEMLYLAMKALRIIKQSYGQVCNEFELCTHKACQSSYSCWSLASEAIEKVAEVGND